MAALQQQLQEMAGELRVLKAERAQGAGDGQTGGGVGGGKGGGYLDVRA